MRLSIIMAVDNGGCIGKDGALPWRIPSDLKRFKEITMGHPVIMGRNTYESIAHPLEGRHNIVVTSQSDYYAPGCDTATSIEDALNQIDDAAEEVFFIGGKQIYESVWDIVHSFYITRVYAEMVGDTFIKDTEWHASRWRTAEPEHIEGDEYPTSFHVQKWDVS